ncbi:transposase, partial [Longibacter salinarum]
IERAICQQLPPLRKTRRRNLTRFCAGLYEAEHVHLPKIADRCFGRAQQASKTRRLRRFLANEAVRPGDWYRPVARSLLKAAAAAGPVRLLIDTLHLTGERRLLVAAVAFRRRALPVLWRVHATSGVTGQDLQRCFVHELAALVPEEAEVIVIGDGEFHCVSLLQAVQKAGWTYCVRLHADTFVRAFVREDV